MTQNNGNFIFTPFKALQGSGYIAKLEVGNCTGALNLFASNEIWL